MTRIASAGWQHRQRLLSFCTSTVERDLQEKQRLIQGQEPGLDRRPAASLFEEQVLVSVESNSIPSAAQRSSYVQANQLETEKTVESIVRKRTVEGKPPLQNHLGLAD